MSSDSGIIVGADGRRRCWWPGVDPLYLAYHDQEWGRPVAEDRRLFEKICLEGFQAGLSWLTILRKRDAFRRAFAGFEIDAVAEFGDDEIERLLTDASIVRHRGKIAAVVNNARRARELREEAGSLSGFFWRYAPDPLGPERLDKAAIPATTPESQALSKALRQRGWAFVGPTTIYSFMQAMGLVNDHLVGCCCREAVDAEGKVFQRPG